MSEESDSLSEASKERIERLVTAYCSRIARELLLLYERTGSSKSAEAQSFVSLSVLAYLSMEIIPVLKLGIPEGYAAEVHKGDNPPVTVSYEIKRKPEEIN
jgi:hypothetical protein